MKWTEWKRKAVSGNDEEINMNKKRNTESNSNYMRTKVATEIKKKA